MFSKKLIVLALFVLPTFSAPSPLVNVKRVKEPIPGRYLVTLKDGVDRKAHLSARSATHEWDIVNGFAGNFSTAELQDLRSSPDVASIEEDGLFYSQATLTQTNAPWGLARISSGEKLANQDSSALTFTYKYDSTAGSGATVYIIDSGILTSHPAFNGRASWGATFGGFPSKDGHGHGTHCAGIAVSGPYGVAKNAKVVAVKAMSDSGSAAGSDVLSGVNWVASHRGSGPAVVSISLLGDVSPILDAAIVNLVNSGVTVVAAAGNTNVDAKVISPARVEVAITVGASDINDVKASFSNYGAIIDVWAPGVNIISTWNDGKIKFSSGTSMAAPHVAGFVAYLLGLDSSLTLASVRSTMKSHALNNVLSGIPAGTINRLLNNHI